MPDVLATMRPLRIAFVMEQALGHVTHYRNMREFTDQQPDIAPVWLPIPFEVSRLSRLVPVLRSNWSVRASLRARRALNRAQTRFSLDAAIFHTQVTSLFSVDIMRRVPSVISLDATPINYDTVGQYYGHRAAGDGFLDRKKYEMNQRAFQAAAGLVTWSEWARRSLVNDYGVDASRIRVLPPGASQAYFDVGRARSAAETASRAGRRMRVLFVGADFRRKGGPLLLEAMAGRLGSLCELHIVTQSEDVIARPNVIVHRGLQANSPELLHQFAAADLFVLPTHADCLGVVLMEAAAAGLPVITTDVGALSEGLLPDRSGLLIPPGDARALHAALTAMLDEPERRQRMGRAAHAFGSQRFDAQRNNRIMLDFVGELVDARRAVAIAA
jgi:glycosyltransferase involved in cell wall biosynthesis